MGEPPCPTKPDVTTRERAGPLNRATSTSTFNQTARRAWRVIAGPEGDACLASAGGRAAQNLLNGVQFGVHAAIPGGYHSTRWALPLHDAEW